MAPDPNLRLRGDILIYAREATPIGITKQFITAIYQYSDEDAARLDENLVYLVDKGYLRREHLKEPISKVERWVYQLTAKGLDLIQGTIEPDPGVVLVR